MTHCEPRVPVLICTAALYCTALCNVPPTTTTTLQAAALAAVLWLEGALPASGGEGVRVVPVGWPPLLSAEHAGGWEETHARRAEARRVWDQQQRVSLAVWLQGQSHAPAGCLSGCRAGWPKHDFAGQGRPAALGHRP